MSHRPCRYTTGSPSPPRTTVTSSSPTDTIERVGPDAAVLTTSLPRSGAGAHVGHDLLGVQGG